MLGLIKIPINYHQWRSQLNNWGGENINVSERIHIAPLPQIIEANYVTDYHVLIYGASLFEQFR